MSEINLNDSFDWRVCDDLCKQLLKYLSLDDVSRLECVSKQFQRCIFNGQNELIINDKIYQKLRSDPKSVETLIKKLGSFAFLRVNCVLQHGWVGAIDQALIWIIKYCNHLTSIHIKVYEDTFSLQPIIETKTIQEFFQKFGTGLEKMVAFNDFLSIIKYCPKLNDIKIPVFLYLDVNGYQYLRNYFNKETLNSIKNVKRLELMSDNLIFSQFIQNNKNSLQTLICKHCLYRPDGKVLKNIPVLSKLRKLKISLRSSNITEDSVQHFTDNCRQLEVLEIDLHPGLNVDNIEAQNIILKGIHRFPNLRSFTFRFIDFCDSELLNNCLIGCKNIKVLNLHSITQINDHFFTHIDKHLPQLQSLQIINADISDSAIYSLSGIPSLRAIHFYNLSNNTVIEERSVCHLLNNCPKIDSIRLFGSNLDNWSQKKILNLINANIKRSSQYKCFL